MGSVLFLTGVLLFLGLAGAVFAIFVARRFAHRGAQSRNDPGMPTPHSDNPTAFMAASMQAVIQKLRDQEKELEALHRAERERAQQTERLSAAVTHNMPAGPLLVNSAGPLSTPKPAAQIALGGKALAL